MPPIDRREVPTSLTTSLRSGSVRGVIVRGSGSGGPAGPSDWSCADDLGGNTILGAKRDLLVAGGRAHVVARLSEQVIFVAQGSGRTDFSPGPATHVPTIEWRAGDIFALPPAVSVVHLADADAAGPVELLTFSNAPMLTRLFGAPSASCDPFVISDRFDPALGWERSATADDGTVEANVWRDVRSTPLADAPGIGRGTASARARLGGHQTIEVALVQLEHRGHVRRHRHVAEEAIIVLAGRGRTVLTGKQGGEQTFRWRTGDVFVPPLGVWHQHVSEAKPWDLTRLLIVRNRALERAFGAISDRLDTRIPSRFPEMLEPNYAGRAAPATRGMHAR